MFRKTKLKRLLEVGWGQEGECDNEKQIEKHIIEGEVQPQKKH